MSTAQRYLAGWLMATACFADVTGVVTSSGVPLNDVRVSAGLRQVVLTDGNGFYRIPSTWFAGSGPLRLVFQADRHRTTVKELTNPHGTLDVQLDGEVQPWRIPTCREKAVCAKTGKPAHKFQIGGLRLTLPCDAPKAAFEWQEDHVRLEVVRKAGDRKAKLVAVYGPLCCMVQDHSYRDSRSFDERPWTTSGYQQDWQALNVEPRFRGTPYFFDVKGQRGDGSLWRRFGRLVSFEVGYQDADEAAAKYFNGIIDSACEITAQVPESEEGLHESAPPR
jgi:hypothetical protein